MTIEDIAPNEAIEVKDDEFVRSDLQTQLRDEILEVTFTLIEDVAPKNTTEQMEDAPQRKVNEDILSVWDVDAKGWRSFRVKNVTRVRQHVMAGYNNAS